MTRERLLLAGGTLLVLLDLAVPWVVPYARHLPPGGYLAFGVLAAVALARGAKWLGGGWLQQPDPTSDDGDG